MAITGLPCSSSTLIEKNSSSSAQEGEVQQAARQLVRFWLDYLARQVVQGQEKGEWREDLDPWRAVYRLYGLYLGDQVFNALDLCQDPGRHFWPEVEEWDESGDATIRTIKKARLYDGSIVTTPAYDGTSIGLRSLEAHRKARRQKNFSAAALRHRMKMNLRLRGAENG